MSSAHNIRIVAVIQCAIALEHCSGWHCSRAFYKRQNYFKDYSADVIYVPFSCGGCPGRRVSRLISNLKKGALKNEGINKEHIAVHLTACVVTDNGHYPLCPFKDYMKAILTQKGFAVIEGGYESEFSRKRRTDRHYKAYDCLHERQPAPSAFTAFVPAAADGVGRPVETANWFQRRFKQDVANDKSKEKKI